MSMRDAFTQRQLVAIAGMPDSWGGVVQEATGTLSWVRGSGDTCSDRISALRHVNNLALSPDGDAFAAFIDDDGDERGRVLAWSGDATPRDAIRDGRPIAACELAISDAGSCLAVLAEIGDDFEVLVGRPSAGGALTPVLRHAGTLGSLVLSRDGEHLAVAARNPGPSGTWQLRHVSLGGMHASSFVAAPEDIFPCAVLSGEVPVVLASLSSSERAGAALWWPSTGRLHELTLPDTAEAGWDLCDISLDGRALAIRWHRGEAALVTLGNDGRQATVAPIVGAIGQARWASPSTVTALWSDVATPLRLATIDAATGQVLSTVGGISSLPAIAGLRATSDRLVASDGLEFQCWSFLPDPSNEPRGVIIDIHGGPRDLITNQFVPERHAWLSTGHAVFCPNYRGSGGFGRRFGEANFGNPGHAELLDIAATVAHARRLLGDSVPLVLVGWSYGGFLALLHAMHHPEGIRAVIAGAPVLDWTAQHEAAPPDLRRTQAELFGVDLTDEARDAMHGERSPLSHARKLRVPSLILFADGDVRCPASAVEALRREVTSHGLPVSFHEYPGGHASAQFDSEVRLALFERQLDFVERVLQGLDAGGTRAT